MNVYMWLQWQYDRLPEKLVLVDLVGHPLLCLDTTFIMIADAQKKTENSINNVL